MGNLLSCCTAEDGIDNSNNRLEENQVANETQNQTQEQAQEQNSITSNSERYTVGSSESTSDDNSSNEIRGVVYIQYGREIYTDLRGLRGSELSTVTLLEIRESGRGNYMAPARDMMDNHPDFHVQTEENNAENTPSFSPR